MFPRLFMESSVLTCELPASLRYLVNSSQRAKFDFPQVRASYCVLAMLHASLLATECLALTHQWLTQRQQTIATCHILVHWCNGVYSGRCGEPRLDGM